MLSSDRSSCLPQRIPVRVARAFMAPRAQSNFPLILAGGADPSGLERIPTAAAFACPASFPDWYPAAFRASDWGAVGSPHRSALHGRRGTPRAPGFLEFG